MGFLQKIFSKKQSAETASAASLIRRKNHYAQLFEELEELMRDKQAYLQVDLDRKQLIYLLQTNELYLACAIRNAVEKTINKYINDYRLQHATRLLEEESTMNIESIALVSGFASSRHFYRLFREKFQCSPREYIVRKNRLLFLNTEN